MSFEQRNLLTKEKFRFFQKKRSKKEVESTIINTIIC